LTATPKQTEIKTQIEKANASKEGGRGESKGIVEQLKGVRVRIKAASQVTPRTLQTFSPSLLSTAMFPPRYKPARRS
jgi:hypothetical protein